MIFKAEWIDFNRFIHNLFNALFSSINVYVGKPNFVKLKS